MHGPFYSSYSTVHLYPAVVSYSNPLKIVKPASVYQFELIALGVASIIYELQSNQKTVNTRYISGMLLLQEH